MMTCIVLIYTARRRLQERETAALSPFSPNPVGVRWQNSGSNERSGTTNGNLRHYLR